MADVKRAVVQDKDGKSEYRQPLNTTAARSGSSGEEKTFRFSIPKHLIDALPEYREKAEK